MWGGSEQHPLEVIAVDVGILILRLVFGLAMAGHGAQKLLGWFGGPGMTGVTGFMRQLRFRPPQLWMLAAVASETAGGLLLAAGLLSPLGSLAMVAAMLIAALAVHWGKGFFAQQGGVEVPALYLAAAVTAAITGPGRYSLDSLLGISLPEPVTGIVGAVLVVLGVAAAFASRPRTAPQGA
jgi:putative oxidoreductase